VSVHVSDCKLSKKGGASCGCTWRMVVTTVGIKVASLSIAPRIRSKGGTRGSTTLAEL